VIEPVSSSVIGTVLRVGADVARWLLRRPRLRAHFQFTKIKAVSTSQRIGDAPLHYSVILTLVLENHGPTPVRLSGFEIREGSRRGTVVRPHKELDEDRQNLDGSTTRVARTLVRDEPISEYIGQGKEYAQMGIRKKLVCVLYDGHRERRATLRIQPARVGSAH
jgi:hypothetical protein